MKNRLLFLSVLLYLVTNTTITYGVNVSDEQTPTHCETDIASTLYDKYHETLKQTISTLEELQNLFKNKKKILATATIAKKVLLVNEFEIANHFTNISYYLVTFRKLTAQLKTRIETLSCDNNQLESEIQIQAATCDLTKQFVEKAESLLQEDDATRCPIQQEAKLYQDWFALKIDDFKTLAKNNAEAFPNFSPPTGQLLTTLLMAEPLKKELFLQAERKMRLTYIEEYIKL